MDPAAGSLEADIDNQELLGTQMPHSLAAAQALFAAALQKAV